MEAAPSAISAIAPPKAHDHRTRPSQLYLRGIFAACVRAAHCRREKGRCGHKPTRSGLEERSERSSGSPGGISAQCRAILLGTTSDAQRRSWRPPPQVYSRGCRSASCVCRRNFEIRCFRAALCCSTSLDCWSITVVSPSDCAVWTVFGNNSWPHLG